jgi:hypothetical protein
MREKNFRAKSLSEGEKDKSVGLATCIIVVIRDEIYLSTSYLYSMTAQSLFSSAKVSNLY